MVDLFHRLTGYDAVAPFLRDGPEDTLVAFGGKPVLVHLPGTEPELGGRLIACLLHGNEDSGLLAVLDLLRRREAMPFDVWVLIGNTRAATTGGWFAHRYLDDQEDFNRVWGLGEPTTRMRRCADAILDELVDAKLVAGIDLHNNTGDSPPYAVLPVRTSQTLDLAALVGGTGLLWPLPAHTLMQALSPHTPAVAVECGRIGDPDAAAFATSMTRRFLDADLDAEPDGTGPEELFEITHRVVVRPEVSFAFGGVLDDATDLVLTPGLDGANFGMLLAGTELGRVLPGSAVPLAASDASAQDAAERLFTVDADGVLRTTGDVVPAMMTTTVQQARRDCLFYLCRRRR